MKERPFIINYIQKDVNLRENSILSKMIDFIKPKPDNTVLDMGCGAFNATMKIYPHVYKIFALDKYPNPRKEFKKEIKSHKRSNKVNIIKSDINRISKIFKPETFDIVIAYFSLHHFPDPIKVIKQVNNILKCGGKFYISEGTFLDKNLSEIFQLLRIFRYKNWRPYLNPKRLKIILENEGFYINKYKIDQYFPDTENTINTLYPYSHKSCGMKKGDYTSICRAISVYLQNLPSVWKGNNITKNYKIYYDVFQILSVKK